MRTVASVPPAIARKRRQIRNDGSSLFRPTTSDRRRFFFLLRSSSSREYAILVNGRDAYSTTNSTSRVNVVERSPYARGARRKNHHTTPFRVVLTYRFRFIGHTHITDFNIAATLHDKKLASSLSGTKPYIGTNYVYINVVVERST